MLFRSLGDGDEVLVVGEVLGKVVPDGLQTLAVTTPEVRTIRIRTVTNRG